MVSKAQISAEFFIFSGLVLLIAISFEAVSLEQLNDFKMQKESGAVKDLALKLQKELIIAAIVEDGYSRVFEIPEKLEDINYSLATQNATVTVISKNSIYIVPIPQATGNISKGTNRISKKDGITYINYIN